MFNTISNNERQFLLNNLSCETGPIRNVKRSKNNKDDPTELYRKISIKKLKENGQVELKIGDTMIISQIFAKLTPPQNDRPNEGYVAFSVSTIYIVNNSKYKIFLISPHFSKSRSIQIILDLMQNITLLTKTYLR